MMSQEHETVYQAAKQCAKDAMSLSQLTASRHANTYFRQQQPAMSLITVIEIFRKAFAEKREEEEEED